MGPFQQIFRVIDFTSIPNFKLQLFYSSYNSDSHNQDQNSSTKHSSSFARLLPFQTNSIATPRLGSTKVTDVYRKPTYLFRRLAALGLFFYKFEIRESRLSLPVTLNPIILVRENKISNIPNVSLPHRCIGKTQAGKWNYFSLKSCSSKKNQVKNSLFFFFFLMKLVGFFI